MKRRIFLSTIIVVSTVVLTSLSIDAADTLRGRSGTLLSNIISATKSGCPSGMVHMAGTSFSCVDAYENSADPSCPEQSPTDALKSKTDVDAPSCMSVSVEGVLPWTNVTREQARALCSRRGARLPSNNEWYEVALGMQDVDGACNTEGQKAEQTGSFPKCVSKAGVFDLIGNVWEWTTDDAISGVYNGRPLPDSGYVSQVDQGGVAVASKDTPDDAFYHDYVWTNKTGAYGMLRGGFFGSHGDAGIYTLHAQTLPTTPGAGIGFRCVQ
jgi:hypothetical protein